MLGKSVMGVVSAVLFSALLFLNSGISGIGPSGNFRQHSEVVFIDSAVRDAEIIVAQLPENAQVVRLASDANGVRQISDYLAHGRNLSAVHIISHGNAGYLVLCGKRIDIDFLKNDGDQIRSWNRAFQKDGEILLYACNLALGEKGKRLVEGIGKWTATSVRASSNLTGKGGDWRLEYATGATRSEVLDIRGYPHYLADQIVTNNADSGPGSLRQAMADVGDGEKITFNGNYTITLTSGALVVDKNLTITGNGTALTIINGNQLSRVFNITAGILKLEKIGIQNGRIAVKIDLTGPATATAGAVSSAFTPTSQDAFGNASDLTADTRFDLSSNSSGTKTFYSDAAGTSVITQVAIPNGSSTANFYYKDTNAGTPTVTAAWNSGGTDLGSDTHKVTVSLPDNTLQTSSSVASTFSDFSVTVTKVRMFNGSSWVTIFSGSANLDVVNGGTFPGVSGVNLPAGTYSKIEVTFLNSFTLKGKLTYSGNTYYTTAGTFGGATHVANDPTTSAGAQVAYVFSVEDWGAFDTERTETFDIDPVTVEGSTDYQPTLMFTISKSFLLKGVAGDTATYYFKLSPPTVSIVEP